MFNTLLQADNYQGHVSYNVGVYVRLSREDDDKGQYGNPSESIANQREYLTRYIIEQGWNLVDVYSDDGYTGTNFNRPDFQRLIRDIEVGKVNLVITKDLSRLGRDYIETGHYLERYFPTHNVRYIALNDGIDTFERNNSNNDMSPFKAVMNDFYARDISKKVKSTIHPKQEKGLFIGAFAPYGYLKDPADRNKLIIDPKTAPVIQRIFKLYTEDYLGYSGIAKLLTSDGVLSPSSYKATYSLYKNPKKLKTNQWTLETVRVILMNPTYAGHVTQRKHSVISYKVKNMRTLPRTANVSAQNTCDPLVSQEVFDAAQYLIKRKTNSSAFKATEEHHTLRGLLYCKDCGSRMTFVYTHKRECYCVCSTNKRFGTCSRHSYRERDLEQFIVDDLQRLLKEHYRNAQEELRQSAESSIKERKAKQAKDPMEHLKAGLNDLQKRLEEIKKIVKALYEDKIKGVITEQDFIDFSQEYNTERTQVSSRIAAIQQKASEAEQIRSRGKQEGRTSGILRGIQDLMEFKGPFRQELLQLILRIDITETFDSSSRKSKGSHAHIAYNFKLPSDEAQS